MKLPVVVDVSAPATVAPLAKTVSSLEPSAIMSTLAPTVKSVLASTVTTVAEALVNLIVLPMSVEVRVRAVVASVAKLASGLEMLAVLAATSLCRVVTSPARSAAVAR